jgi:hypothetical protein
MHYSNPTSYVLLSLPMFKNMNVFITCVFRIILISVVVSNLEEEV